MPRKKVVPSKIVHPGIAFRQNAAYMSFVRLRCRFVKNSSEEIADIPFGGYHLMWVLIFYWYIQQGQNDAICILTYMKPT
jgi:hypothetical protein